MLNNGIHNEFKSTVGYLFNEPIVRWLVFFLFQFKKGSDLSCLTFYKFLILLGEFSAGRKCHAIVFEEKPSEAPERGPFTSIISKSRLLSKGPSEKSRALVFALTILVVTITCLVFLLGVRVIRGENHITQDEDIERILEQILGPNFGHLNISDSDVQNFTFTHGHI